MIEKFDRLVTTLDNFKYHKFSVLCELIRKITIAHINKEDISEIINDERYDQFKTILTYIKDYQQYAHTSDKLKDYFGTINADGLPFDGFDAEPVYVKNLKNVLNALYLLEKTFEDLESIDIRVGDHKIWEWKGLYDEATVASYDDKPFWKRWWLKARDKTGGLANTAYLGGGEALSVKYKLLFETTPKAYRASHLLTHLDFSLLGAFVPEYNILKLALDNLNVFSKQIQDYTDITPEKVQTWIQPDQLGMRAGEGLFHLKSEGGSVDVGFLTHFGASLPQFFQQLTESLNKLSPDLASVESTVSKEHFDRFEELAEKILVETEKLQNRNSLLLPLYVLNYIRLLQDIISLGKGVVEHFSLANETSKEVVIEKLRKLKHEYIGQFFLVLDKTEAELMLEPGTLSKPWMNLMNEYWKTIARYANNLIDLKQKAPDLIALNDFALVRKRRTALEHRVDKWKSIWDVKYRKNDAFTRFYHCLENLSSNSSVTKEELTILAKHYLLIQDYVIKERPKLHAKLVENYFSSSAIENYNNGFWTENYHYYMPGMISWPECKTELLSIKDKINDANSSEQNTALLHNKIAAGLIKFVDVTANLPLIPWQQQTLPTIEKEDDDITRVLINLNEARRERTQITKALKDYTELKAMLNKLIEDRIFYMNDISAKNKNKIIQLYASLQPYFDAYIKTENRVSWVQFDKKIVQALTGDIEWLPDDPSFLLINDILVKFTLFEFDSNFLEEQNAASNRVRQLESERKETIGAHKEELQYVKPKVVLERANYVFKWDFFPKIPKWIHDQRDELMKWLLANYGEVITNEIRKGSKTDIPFPEIEDTLTRLSQPHQLVMIKQILNAMYYLEQSFEKLAELREDSYQTTYVLQLLQAYQGIEQIYELGLALKGDPYLLAFINKFKQQFKEVQENINDHARPYQVESKEVGHHHQEPIKWSALWYTIQALRVLPGHLQTLVEGKPLAESFSPGASYSAKKTCLEIEDLINKSDSYLQIFLALPQISKLSYQLRDESLSLGQKVNHSVVDNFERILNGPVAGILIEADKFEIEVGLKSGTVSEPIRKVLSKFFTELVIQQQLPSKTTFDILFSQSGLIRRINAIINSKADRLHHMDLIDKQIEFIEPAIEWLDTFYRSPKDMTLDEKTAFINWFKINKEDIERIEKENNLPLEIPRKPKTSFENAIKDIEPNIFDGFSDLEFRLRSLKAKLYGENASNLFAIEKQENHFNFLADDTLYPKVIASEKQQQMSRYIEFHFNRIALPYIRPKKGLEGSLDLELDYTEQCKKYVDQERERIVNELCERPLKELLQHDILKMTEDAAKESMWRFVQNNYQDYVLLSDFLKQLHLCRTYVIELSIYEKSERKQQAYRNFRELLDDIEKMAKNNELKPEERIVKLKALTSKQSNFHSRLMNIRNSVEPFTWLWFKQCIEDLLAFLNLRKSTRQDHYDKLRNNLENPSVPLNQLYKTNGFFTLQTYENNQQQENKPKNMMARSTEDATSIPETGIIIGESLPTPA